MMGRTDKYRLNAQGEPEPFPGGLLEWAKWYGEAHKPDPKTGHSPLRVARTLFESNYVSTIFLSLDHNWCEEGPPILWETMVFGGRLNQECDRCGGSREQALAMHQAMVERVEKADGVKGQPLEVYQQ